MTLHSIEENSPAQPAVGRRDYWRLFESFQGSALHSAIVAELQDYPERNFIDSSIAGRDILSRLESTSPELFDEYPEDVMGGLFGMTLWNLLAKHPTRWHFLKQQADPLDDPSGTNYFRTRLT